MNLSQCDSVTLWPTGTGRQLLPAVGTLIFDADGWPWGIEYNVAGKKYRCYFDRVARVDEVENERFGMAKVFQP
jgi:hypothetical protein